MEEELEKFFKQVDREDYIEHRDALLAIGTILKTEEGRKLFKYLFKTLGVAELPSQDMEGNILHEYLGFLRSGNSIYKLTCEADSEIAASILSNIERKKYDRTYEQHRIEHSNS